MATHLVGIQQRQGANILHSVPTGVTYEDTEITGRPGLLVTTFSQYWTEHQVATGVCSGCWAVGSLGTSWVASGLRPEGAVCSFVSGVKDWDVKQYLLIGSERSLNEALNQALKLETVKIAQHHQHHWRSKGWTYYENMVTSNQTLQDWTTHMMAVWGFYHLRNDCWQRCRKNCLEVADWESRNE
jgi:hypothetical protein